MIPGFEHLSDGPNDFVWWEIFDYNAYAIERTDVQDRCVIDIGGHRGYFSALAASWGAKRVVAVEANPINFAQLVRNLQGVEVTKLCAAVWPVGGRLVSISDAGAESVVSPQGVYIVPTVTLNTVLEVGGTPRVVMKMDIEGTEAALIKESLDIFERVDVLFIELHGEESLTVANLRLLDTVGLRTVWRVRPTNFDNGGRKLEIHKLVRTG